MASENSPIHYTFVSCWLGEILVAAHENELCAVLIGDDRDQLADDLQQRMGKIPCIADDNAMAKIRDTLALWLDNPSKPLELPLAPRGTPFQQQVWAALREIPAGETIDYAALAARIGKPTAARAVAAACAANPLAIVTPCHRVVRRDGGLSGYRWGTWRKRALLEREAERSCAGLPV